MSIVALVAVCAFTGLGIRMLRRLPRLVFLVTLFGYAGMLVLLASAPADPIDLVGRTLTLEPAARAVLLVSISTTAILALFSPLTFLRAADNPASIISNSLGAFLFACLAPFVLAIALDSFPLAVLFWALGLLPLLFLAQPRCENRAGGAAQFLLLTVVAAVCLLLANRMLDLYPLTPENLDLLRGAILFLFLGLGILLAVVPLNFWMGSFADEIPLLGVAFLIAVAQPIGLWLLIGLLTRLPWLVDKSPLLSVLSAAGIASVVVGALLAIAERRDHRFLAALALIPLGDVLLGIGMGTRLGLLGALALVANRALGVALTSGGFSFVRHHTERRWQTTGIIAILAGGFVLLGMPPGLGASARWGIYSGLENPVLLLTFVGASAAGALALLRLAVPLIASTQVGTESHGELKIVPYFGAGLVFLLIALALISGIFPQAFVEPLIVIVQRAEFVK